MLREEVWIREALQQRVNHSTRLYVARSLSSNWLGLMPHAAPVRALSILVGNPSSRIAVVLCSGLCLGRHES